MANQFVVAHIIPTGVKADIGGVEVVCLLKTKKEVQTRAIKTRSNSFVGEIVHEDALIDACRSAIKKGAQALAISLAIQIHIRDLKAYFAGKGANPYGGAEAIISHLATATFGIPAAHAPLLSKYEIYRETHSGTVDPRAAAEAIGPAYLGCVLQGLDRAPRLVTGAAMCVLQMSMQSSFLTPAWEAFPHWPRKSGNYLLLP